ncbi:LytS/YhcK type 5TM receptor domain-containing protein [Desulfurivibrio sp. D14AmB]|uniref:LytS/YhcK type 5TM receptor domain-containing protein n=1 Tax=Desulfurivibrio sp. D14AmB TaxID=3374370 RepID=UPI00376F0AFB
MTISIELIFNLALLVALSIISGFIAQRWPQTSRRGLLLQGLLFGGAAVVGMLNPLVLGPGLIFDGRSVMISLCGLFYGPWAAGVAGLLTIVARLEMGGAGAFTGVMTTITALVAGLLAHYRLTPNRRPLTTSELYLFGLALHLAVLLVMYLTFPAEIALDILKRVGLPIILLYPLATILVGKILVDQAALRTSEQNYRRLFEDHAAIKMLIDPDTGAIITANHAAAAFYGWSREQLQTMNIKQINILPPEQIEEEIKKVRANSRVHFEFKHRRADGSLRDVAVFSSKTTMSGRELLHSIVMDITEQKEAEREQQKLRAQLLQARQLEAVGRLAGGVAHEFNNMMTVVLSRAQMAMDHARHNPQLEEDLSEISKAAERSAALTRQLLAFARKQLIIPQTLNLNTVVENIKPLLTNLLGEEIELQWHPEPHLWPLKLDPHQTEQLLLNLVENARDALGESGVINIATANTTLRPSDCAERPWLVPGEYVLLAVSDNGRGMDRETRAHIFDPFFTTKEFGQGPGLGLATVYGIVKQNRGFIDLESEPDRGTTFTVYLPRHHEEEPADERQSSDH